MDRRNFLKGLAALPIAAKMIDLTGGPEAVVELLPAELPDIAPPRIWAEPETPGETYIPPSCPQTTTGAPGLTITPLARPDSPLIVPAVDVHALNETTEMDQVPIGYDQYVPGTGTTSIEFELWDEFGGLDTGLLDQFGAHLIEARFEDMGIVTRVPYAVHTSTLRRRPRHRPDVLTLAFTAPPRSLEWEVLPS